MSAGLGFRSAVVILWLAVALTSPVTFRAVAQESRAPLLHERVWSMPQDVISHPDITERLGRFEKDSSGAYSIYDRKGERIGVASPDLMAPSICTTRAAAPGWRLDPNGRGENSLRHNRSAPNSQRAVMAYFGR